MLAVIPAARIAAELAHTVWNEKSRRATGTSAETGSRSAAAGCRVGSLRVSSSRARFQPLPRTQSPGATVDAAWATSWTMSAMELTAG